MNTLHQHSGDRVRKDHVKKRLCEENWESEESHEIDVAVPGISFVIHTMGLKTIGHHTPELFQTWNGAWDKYNEFLDRTSGSWDKRCKVADRLWHHYLESCILRAYKHRPSMTTTLFHIKDPNKDYSKQADGTKKIGRHTGEHPHIIRSFLAPHLKPWRHDQFGSVWARGVCWHQLTT